MIPCAGTFGDRGSDWPRNDRVEIVSSGSGLDASAAVRVTLPKGRRLTVHLGAGTATVTNADGEIKVDANAASVTTEHTKGVLDLDTGSGGARITDAEGDVNLDSGSGEVHLENVRGESLTVDSGSGEVSGATISVGRLNIDSGSGMFRAISSCAAIPAISARILARAPFAAATI